MQALFVTCCSGNKQVFLFVSQVCDTPHEAYPAWPSQRNLHQAAGGGEGEERQLRPRGLLTHVCDSFMSRTVVALVWKLTSACSFKQCCDCLLIIMKFAASGFKNHVAKQLKNFWICQPLLYNLWKIEHASGNRSANLFISWSRFLLWTRSSLRWTQTRRKCLRY